MISLQEFFNKPENTQAKGIVQKNNILKRNIIAHMAIEGDSTLADLAKQLHISIPTVTKLVDELLVEGIVADRGKIETSGGRRPNVFGLTNSSIYFAGAEVSRDQIIMVVTDLQNNIIHSERKSDFALDDTDECLETICSTIENFIDRSGIDRTKLLGIGVCMAGRVNPNTGRSYKYFTSKEESLSEIMEKRFGHKVLLENDTRARCYGEYVKGCNGAARNIVYLNLGRGVAIGVIIDGELYYGKSGFAGEFGHTPYFDNEIICDCGKKGCLETEVSGVAIENKMMTQIRNGRTTILMDKYQKQHKIHISDIINAAKNDDTLSIELIEEAGEKIGKSIAFLINIFNPEQVIIGGSLSHAGDYLMLPLKTAVNKYSLRLVYNDTQFRATDLDDNIGSLGAAMLIRNKIISI
ncbi:ROK family transcriptional regulator [uncultured Alistipes sp.]|uniref:ROK family transcriptional regulator n=1 Tax=uncultured Alistipes sp. TaxID=538949 RepID=UPI00260472BB|nr:ROK family transcriptional regulator [uncultured Alistipes sp.]